MPQGPETKTEFKFILNSVRPDSVQAVAQELTDLFPLDLATATNIAKNTPIILLDKLTPQQARKVGTYAIRLKALGADVQVTAQPVGRLQVLRWPLLPDIAKRPANHAICPNCGAKLQLQVHVATAEGAPAEEGGDEPAAKPPPLPSQPAPAPAPERAAFPEPSPEEPEEAVLELIGEGEPFEFPEGEAVAEDAALRPSQPAPAREAAPAPSLGVGGGGSCRVTIIGKIKGKKKLKAAELMAHYLGLEQEETLSQLNKKTVVTVGKALTEKQAEQCREQFAEIGVKVTIKG